MKNKELSRKEVAEMWGVHVSSVPIIMARFGSSGRKNGPMRGCRRTYLADEVSRVNQLRIASAGRKGAQ